VVEDYKQAPTLFTVKLKGEIVHDGPGEGPIPTYSITAHCSLYRTYPDIAKAALAENRGQWEITPATNFLALTVDDGVWTATPSDWELTGPFNGPKVSGKERVAIGPPGGDFVVKSGGIYSIIGTNPSNLVHFDQSILYVYKVFFPNDSETIASWDKADGYDVKARLSADSYNKNNLKWTIENEQARDYFTVDEGSGKLKLIGAHPTAEQLKAILVRATSRDMSDAMDEFTIHGGESVKVNIEAEGLSESEEEREGIYIPINNDYDFDSRGRVNDIMASRLRSDEWDLRTITRLEVEPSEYRSKGTLKLSVSGGHLRIWDSRRKNFTPSLTWDLTNETPPDKLYVEGVSLSNSARDCKLLLSYSLEEDGIEYAAEDKVLCSVYGIKSVEWKEAPDGGQIGQNKGPGEGKMIFPDKKRPG